MKSIVRDIFPGGNTPYGFYSYYDHILRQNKAERIFCIKGGPGVGKSTLMKSIADIFIKKGDSVDRFWCSADPGSLDGVLLKERNIAIVDGTAPHVIDPRNPGAVDEIIDLARFLDMNALKKEKDEIIACSESVSARYDAAYTYLKKAKVSYDYMGNIFEELNTGVEKIFSDIMRNVTGKKDYTGIRKKFFAGAITSDGIKSFIGTLSANIKNVYLIKVPVGGSSYDLLKNVSSRLIEYGYDTEEYYCPMEPASKLEHVISEKAGIAVFTVNDYHDMSCIEDVDKHYTYELFSDMKLTGYEKDMYRKMKEQSHEDINRAIEMLNQAKGLHDELEKFYIKNMDFSRLDDVRGEIIAKIG